MVKYITVPENKILAGSFGFTMSDKESTFEKIAVRKIIIYFTYNLYYMSHNIWYVTHAACDMLILYKGEKNFITSYEMKEWKRSQV